jgi:glutathione peroxidase
MKSSKLYFIIIVILATILYNGCVTREVPVEKNIYEFTAKSIDGKDSSLSKYQGEIVLIVNVASKCGFTSQYAELQKLYETYKDKGFIVLGFPCNQFGSQEPGDEKSIQNFCQINYGVTFPLFAKIDVNGKNAHPLYRYLTAIKSGLFGHSIKWNFTKFLINQQGVPVERYASITAPKKIAKDIEKIINKKAR